MTPICDECQVNLGKISTKDFSADEVSLIFAFLKHDEIMDARVCTTWRDAAKKTLVPHSDVFVHDLTSYNALRVMATALPNLQQLEVGQLGDKCKYSDGEDPIEDRYGLTANYTPHDINFISNFRKLQILDLVEAPLNGRYPVLFNFPLLQKLNISYGMIPICQNLKFDFGMLSGCPLLKELTCHSQYGVHLEVPVTGYLSNLRVLKLKNTLEKLDIHNCPNIHGNFMDLADFPRLKELNLEHTNVTGDIRHIREGDFAVLECLYLPSTVIGGMDYKFQHVSDVPSFMNAIYPLITHTLKRLKSWEYDINHIKTAAFYWSLSSNSTDWYDWSADDEDPGPPFWLSFVEAGSRLGWCWCSNAYAPEEESYCEINWLDPEPHTDSEDYNSYAEDLKRVGEYIHIFGGYYEPPTEQEYHRLCEEY